ncbi:Z1 domain-containing protein [Micromonospora sp. WMMD710]|uniref:Z1 domain-containing protein n=1 Tax=Micromonospora sp. WMMD710 TaxID=3016085 RepID=UPI0024180C6D|nr:Z1 domain-containing protein [Micromonospora sp. WMMD710]MDG4760303.1 Z1 domain-containing protein [Micromonospora sp. WMMD710]
MSDTVTTAYSAALDAMQRPGPKPLHALAAMLGGDAPGVADGSALLSHLQDVGPEDALRQQFAHALAAWDHEQSGAPWTGGTSHNTAARRAAVIAALGTDEQTAALFADLFPFAAADGPIVIADDWAEWRTPQRRTERSFYWAHYQRYLLDKWRNPDAVADLDKATEEVVRRLSDPTRSVAYQAKGLVVGYVQSGKTANFTGVVAKAIDAGYRLVIVLTGTTNMLRAQTQRRLDIELCGRENIEREISPHDQKAHEYQDDPDWKRDRFVRHGGRPSDAGYPDIHRLSNHAGDYRRLKMGFSALEFRGRERNRKFFDPANLHTSDARLVVAKKNASVLEALVADLGRISERLGEVPVLIIDDESDQASVNTVSPKKWKEDSKKRTAINRLIGQLLRMMPRAQYVGYTATPYANVFIDPSDVEDIFPRDFLISLPRPDGYMGAEDFHDFDAELPLEQRPLLTSKERAHVRYLGDEPDDGELRRAMDMFVLTGAVKLYRQRHGTTYRHHTMLVHEAMGKDSHRQTAELIGHLWNTAGYYRPSGLARLRDLYLTDILPVSSAQSPALLTPADFDDLRDDIGEALRLVSPADRNGSPVIVVNSDTDLERQQESLDFDKREIWRILVGGNKLARGFTVEGLTVTYYRRATTQVDTLMQMGRWFGFRPGYRDLVRLYTTPDLHDMFEAACRDEDFLRRELRQYAAPADGTKQLTPRQIPPLIAQHRPDLRPTGRNKMWNAKLVLKSSPGQPMEPVAFPSVASKMKHNLEQWEPLLAAAAQRSVKFAVPGAKTTYEARVAVVSHAALLAVLGNLKWLADDTFQPELAWLRRLSDDQLARWVVLLPQQTRSTTRRLVAGQGPFSIFERQRTSSSASFRVFSEERHRNAAMRIAGVDTATPDSKADALGDGSTGAIILYPTVEKGNLSGSEGQAIEDEKTTIGFHLVTPSTTVPAGGKLMHWVTVDKTNPYALLVDTP